MSRSTSRRDFLKTSGVVAGTAATGLSLSRSAHAAGSDLMKVALVGCGGRGNGAIANRLNVGDNCEIVAVADAFQDKADNAAKSASQRQGGKEVASFAGFDAYKKAIDMCDQALIATSPGFRPIHYKYAIENGKHVFMEKPCCTDAPGYRMLMEANKLADEKKLSVVVGLQRRHDAKYIQTMEQIWDGAIGDLSFSRVYWNGGGVWTRARQEGDTEMRFQMRNWYYFVWLCGDNICEQHVHNLDIGNWAASGGDRMLAHPVEANGMGGRQVRKGMDVYGHIFDHHFIEYTMPNGSKMFSQCRHIRQAWSSVTEYIHGSKGVAQAGKVSGDNDWSFERGWPGVANPYTDGTLSNPYDVEHLNLVNAIRNGGHINDGYHGAMSSFTAVLGRMATYSGKVVKWDDAVKSGPEEMIYDDSISWDTTPPVTPDEDGLYEGSVAMPGTYQPY
jgi:myo-inositol 2-dehydrogenase / D-chiro-inositol 1-dehydrogenase